MNENKLKEFVIASNDLPYHIKNNLVYMKSTHEPTCCTPGCHAGLISIVADYLPELRDCYNTITGSEPGNYSKYSDKYHYSFNAWTDALAMYLGFEFRNNGETHFLLSEWAEDNAEMWGNNYGEAMFYSSTAFGWWDGNFTHSVIIDHWSGVLDRLNKKGKIK